MNSKLTILAIIFLLFLIVPLFADIALDSYLSEQHLQLYWDEVMGRGIIWRGDEMVSFMLNLPVFSHNLNEFITSDAAYMSNGRILIPDSTREILDGIFHRDPDSVYRKVSKIVIDAGHGGKDPGTIGTLPDGSPIYEKDIVLEVALDLAKRLRETYPEKEIILSRDSDVYLTLEQRTDLANGLAGSPNEKILFLSIHANAALNKQASGFEIWYLPPEYERELLHADDVDEESRAVVPVLNYMLEEEYSVESELLAQSIERGMQGTVSTYTHSRGLLQNDWYVVRNSNMPAVLVEVGFVTNPREVTLLNNPLYLQKISEGIYNGVSEFVQDFENVSQ